MSTKYNLEEWCRSVYQQVSDKDVSIKDYFGLIDYIKFDANSKGVLPMEDVPLGLQEIWTEDFPSEEEKKITIGFCKLLQEPSLTDKRKIVEHFLCQLKLKALQNGN